MKNQRTTLIAFVMMLVIAQIHSQIDIQPNNLGVNVCLPVSDVGVNTVGAIEYAVDVQATYDGNGSAAIIGRAFEVTGSSGNFTTGLIGIADSFATGNRANGVSGIASRDQPRSNGRSTGVYGQAGDSTPGANYGVFGRLVGSNSGGGIVGYDGVTDPGWSLVLPFQISYAGYFRGKGYFHDNLGVGQEDPKDKIHVTNGNVYVETVGNGIILNNGTDCYLITVDATGALQSTLTNCP